MNSRVLELYGCSTAVPCHDWAGIANRQHCPFLGRKCTKTRKSSPKVSIGTCIIGAGRSTVPLAVCPCRMLERRQVFTDCLTLLAGHEKGNELHVVSEVEVPGGSVDFFLISARDRKTRDFVGIEVQTLDTTGTIWPERQRFLRSVGVAARERDTARGAGVGVNWKMTAKTTLVQLHHKVTTFEHVNRRLVLVLQDVLLAYMQREFTLDHLRPPRLTDALHIHAYRLDTDGGELFLAFDRALSTDAAGIAVALGLRAEAKVDLQVIHATLDPRLSDRTLFRI